MKSTLLQVDFVILLFIWYVFLHYRKSNILVSFPRSSRIKEQHNSIFVEAAAAGGGGEQLH